MSDSLRPHESQHTRPPCPSPTPEVHSDSCLLSRWCHPAISSSVVPFSSCPQSLPALESTLRMRWPKYWSFSFSIIPSKEPPGLISFRMDWLDLLAVQGTLTGLSWWKTFLLSRNSLQWRDSHTVGRCCLWQENAHNALQSTKKLVNSDTEGMANEGRLGTVFFF